MGPSSSADASFNYFCGFKAVCGGIPRLPARRVNFLLADTGGGAGPRGCWPWAWGVQGGGGRGSLCPRNACSGLRRNVCSRTWKVGHRTASVGWARAGFLTRSHLRNELRSVSACLSGGSPCRSPAPAGPPLPPSSSPREPGGVLCSPSPSRSPRWKRWFPRDGAPASHPECSFLPR